MNSPPDNPEERAALLRTDIERTRAELGQTVAELAYKADVKARVANRAAAVDPRVPLGAVLGAIFAVLAYVWWRHH